MKNLILAVCLLLTVAVSASQVIPRPVESVLARSVAVVVGKVIATERHDSNGEFQIFINFEVMDALSGRIDSGQRLTGYYSISNPEQELPDGTKITISQEISGSGLEFLTKPDKEYIMMLGRVADPSMVENWRNELLPGFWGRIFGGDEKRIESFFNVPVYHLLRLEDLSQKKELQPMLLQPKK